MRQAYQKLNMSKPTVFRICIQGELDESWSEYFGTKSAMVEEDEAGNAVTVFISEPMDQGALVGLINHLNDLGIPLISVDPIRKE
jgi:hypothetical protein